jgi:hypothetical protein
LPLIMTHGWPGSVIELPTAAGYPNTGSKSSEARSAAALPRPRGRGPLRRGVQATPRGRRDG